jgi:hypothetical protein
MVAISLAKLRIQIENLRLNFSYPHRFVRSMTDLLELYSDQTYHPNSEKQTYRLPYYQVPPIISQQLNRELQLLAREFPEDSLENAHLLWLIPYYETKVLAARLLGSVPSPFYADVINEIHGWQTSGFDPALVNELLGVASENLRADNSKELLKKIKTWLQEETPQKINLGITGLQVIANDPHFENLPALLNLFAPLIELPTDRHLNECVRLYHGLIQRFPEEMQVFSQKIAARSRGYYKQKLLRKAFSGFPSEISNDLKSLLPKLKL